MLEQEKKGIKKYVKIEELEKLFSDTGYICLGHGIGRSGDSADIVNMIFNNGLRTKDNSLYFTTVVLSTPTPELKQQYNDLGLPLPSMESLKNQLNNWQHLNSKKIIIARIPTKYINTNGDRSDKDGEMYGAFMTEELSSEGKVTYYLDPKFIVGCFDVEKQEIELNSKFEPDLLPSSIARLESRYKRVLEKTRERLKKLEETIIFQQETLQPPQENIEYYQYSTDDDFFASNNISPARKKLCEEKMFTPHENLVYEIFSSLKKSGKEKFCASEINYQSYPQNADKNWIDFMKTSIADNPEMKLKYTGGIDAHKTSVFIKHKYMDDNILKELLGEK